MAAHLPHMAVRLPHMVVRLPDMAVHLPNMAAHLHHTVMGANFALQLIGAHDLQGLMIYRGS